MHWIIQENIFGERAYEQLIDVLERGGYDYSIHKVVPFVGELIPTPLEDDVGSRVICFGSYSMRHAADKYEWEPGVFDLEPQDFTKQLQHWGQHMLNYDSCVVKFADAQLTEPVSFIRPILDSKSFSGRVFDIDEFQQWQHGVCSLGEDYGDSVTPNTLIQIAPCKKIYSEYRFWVVAGKIVTASLYKRGGKLFTSSISNHDHRALFDYTNARISEWQPHQAFCIDICDTPDGYKIVEINTLNASGFYAADIQLLVNALDYEFGEHGVIVPPVNSKRWAQIQTLGCSCGNDSYTNEFYCGHDYRWYCDDCPAFQEQEQSDDA